MKKQARTTTLLTVILFGMCAVIWILNVVLRVVKQTHDYAEFDFILTVLCALVWIAAFIVQLIRYRRNKKTDS